MTTIPRIVTFTCAAEPVAARLADVTGGEVRNLAGAPDAAWTVRGWFEAGDPIVGVCAAGILVRMLAPVLGDKRAEPPVLAVSTDGRHIVPLLGGHHGANRLALEFAEALGMTAAVTTASDSRFAFGLDEPPTGFAIADSAAAKPAMAAVLAGENLRVEGPGDWLGDAGYPLADDGAVTVIVTDRAGRFDGLTYHPRTLVAGVGCARGTGADEIAGLVTGALEEAGLARQSLAALVTIDIKADEAGLIEAAGRLDVPLRLFTADELAAREVPNPSEVVKAETGTPSVAEAAAQNAGPLVVEKRKSANATVAIGRAERPLDAKSLGRAPGELHIVGIGPGEAAQRTQSAIEALRTTTDWVGYGLYLDLIADVRHRQTEHRFDLGDEEKRVRHALEEAGKGKRVALVCSGDGQIYAMAALVYELLAAEGARAISDAARRVGVECHPGISAFQMASARAGALIGHDFCCVSLSDLLTPREAIMQRLEGAATGDFVTALYNPRSKRRTDLIEVAKNLFLKRRPADTPVVVATNLGRPGERVRTVALAELDPTEIDMLTIVLIGATQSRSFVRGDGRTVAFTPRGYASKAEAAE